MADSLSYLPIEVRSYLPGGWVLSDSEFGTWDAKEKTWKIKVVDGADAAHTVAVDADAVGSVGRLEALRKAIDRTYRKSLGKKGIFG
jgi:hypothetical protein